VAHGPSGTNPFLVVHAVRDGFDEDHGLGLEALIVLVHAVELHREHVCDVVLLVGLEDVVLEVGSSVRTSG
jgi:hypothetical protein